MVFNLFFLKECINLFDLVVDLDDPLKNSIEIPRTLEITFGIKPNGVNSNS